MNTPARLPSDSAGFLVGQPIGDDEATRLLAGIKRDTGAILAAMRQLRTAQREERRYRKARELADSARGRAMVSRAAAVPQGRSGSVSVARDPVTGRFMAQPRPPAGQPQAAAEQRQARDIGEVAKAATNVARTAETARRDAKADRAGQSRGADGRFGAGGRDGEGGAGGGGLGSSAGALAGGAGTLLEGTEQVDPLLGAANELKGMAAGAKAVWEPIGRAGSGLFGNRDESEGWLRKLWREFRAMRKDSAKGTKDTIKAVKGVRGGGGEGGGLLDTIFSAVPMLLRGKGLLAAGAAGIAAWVASAVSDTVKGALSSAWETLKKTPIVGSLAQGAEAVVNMIRGKVGGQQPLKSSAPGMEGVLTNAAHAAGVDANLVMAIAKYESRMDPTARPVRKDGTVMSSAHGLGQFTDDTWLDAIRRFGQKAGAGRGAETTMAEAQALRNDPELQARMLAEWTAKNAGQARRAFGKHDPAAVYGMHVLGESDGPKFLRALRANPSAPISSVLSEKVIANNPSLFSGATLGDAFGKLGKAVAGASRDMGAPRLPTATVRQLPSATSIPAISRVSGISPIAPVAVPALPSMGDLRELSRLNSSPPAPPATVIVQQPLGQDVRDRSIAHVATGGIGGLSRR